MFPMFLVSSAEKFFGHKNKLTPNKGRKRLASLHWQGAARAKRARDRFYGGGSSGTPNHPPFWPKGVIGESPV